MEIDFEFRNEMNVTCQVSAYLEFITKMYEVQFPKLYYVNYIILVSKMRI